MSAQKWRGGEITKAGKKELQRLAKNYNAKRNRIIKKTGAAAESLLPEKANVKKLVENFESAAELKRVLKDLERFTKRGAEQLVKVTHTIEDSNGKKEVIKPDFYVTKYERDKVRRDMRRENARRKKLMDKTNAKVKIGGVEINAQKAYEKETLKPLEIKAKTREEWDEFAKYIERLASEKGKKDRDSDILKQWLKSFETNYGKGTQAAEILKRKIKQIGVDKMREEYYGQEILAGITFQYSKEDYITLYAKTNSYFNRLLGLPDDADEMDENGEIFEYTGEKEE